MGPCYHYFIKTSSTYREFPFPGEYIEYLARKARAQFYHDHSHQLDSYFNRFGFVVVTANRFFSGLRFELLAFQFSEFLLR